MRIIIFGEGMVTGLMTTGLNHLQQGISNYLDVRFNGNKLYCCPVKLLLSYKI